MARRHQKDKQAQVFDMIIGGIGKLVYQRFKRIFPPKRERITKIEARDEFRRLKGIMRLGGEAHFRQAIIEADNFLDKVLKSHGAIGKTLGERLRNCQKKIDYPVYQSVWRAHKIRNRIVHENGFKVLSFHASQTLKDFEKAIEDLL